MGRLKLQTGHYSFRSQEEAARAYDAEAERVWGAFAMLNFPED